MSVDQGFSVPKIAGLVLAAGLSRRAGPVNKLLIDVEGRSMVSAVAANALAAGLSPVVVVTGHEASSVAAAVSGLNVVLAENPMPADGMAGSIRAGIDALDEATDAAMICLGDMPWVRPETMRLLAQTFDDERGRSICRPQYDGQPGNPVIFGRRFFAELKDLAGDRGGKIVIQRHPDALVDVTVDDPGVLRDLDIPQ